MLRRPLTGLRSDLLPPCRAHAVAGQKPAANGQALKKSNEKRSPGERDLTPETYKMRPGKEPHGALQNVHVDQAARKAIIKEKAGATPDEAASVEENCRPDKKLAAVTRQDEKKVTTRRPDRRLENSPDA